MCLLSVVLIDTEICYLIVTYYQLKQEIIQNSQVKEHRCRLFTEGHVTVLIPPVQWLRKQPQVSRRLIYSVLYMR